MSVAQVLPPSPPATSSRKQPYNLPSSLPLTSTPEDSPASGPESSSLGSRKRVEFHPFTNVHSSSPAPFATEAFGIKPLPPSRECQSAHRPILKATVHTGSEVVGMDGPCDVKVPLNEAMESILQQIASNDTTVMVDAYQTLAATIKAYDELPDEAVLKSKLAALTKHIRQHLGALDKADSQPRDINLVTSALKVAVILVWSADFSALLNDDFRIFVTDRAIQVITEHTAPKSVIIHYMHLLATQDFRSGILTSNHRASRLIDGLKNLTEHIKGNGVISERLMVFTRLLDQARSVMKAKSAVWIEPMLLGMASSIPDTRGKALALARKACQAFPPSNSVYYSVREALDLKQDSGKTLGGVISRKLEKWVSNKDTDTAQVPQIWAVVLLLANHPSTPIDKWKNLKDWLAVIQRCFNSSDGALRQQANLAWNRFVFIARPHEAPEGLMSMLAKPIIAQLERPSDKAGKGSHALAVSSYCNLLYYAFRPATTHSQYTRAWNEYIVKVMRSSFFEKNPANADIASRILMALLCDAKTITKVWNENRAHENRSVEPEELPTIDCKWIRSHCPGILNVIEVLFRYSSWGLSGSSDQAFVSKAWRHLLKALKDAASKEIKMSTESRTAVTAVVESLGQLSRCKQTVDNRQPFGLSKLTTASLIRVAIAELGINNILEVLAQQTAAEQNSIFPLVAAMIQDDSVDSNLIPVPHRSELIAKYLEIANKLMNLHYVNISHIAVHERSMVVSEICQVLNCLPRNSTVINIAKLETGLSLWLKDDKRLLSEPSIVDSFCKACMRIMAGVTPPEVDEVDEVFAAAFTSIHKTTVNAMVALWNEKFGSFAELKIGPRVERAIARLDPCVALDLPFGWQKQETEHPSLPTYETEEEHFQVIEPPRRKNDKLVEASERLASKDHNNARREAPPQAKAPQKLRHEDSQIDFLPVESSPRIDMEDSQYLTDRQKTVLERQRTEPVVVFADLRSSPRPRSSRSQSRDCEFARKAASMVERPATPTLPDQNEAGDGDPVPSPTPKSRLLRAVEDAEIPSSPPSMQGRNTERVAEDENMSSPPAEVCETEEQDLTFESPPEEADGAAEPKAPELVVDEGLAVEVGEEIFRPLEPAHDDDPTEVAPDSLEISRHSPAQPKIETGPTAKLSTPLRIRVPSSQIDTDELNEMSASQLSHDLEWSQVFEGLDQQTPEGAPVITRIPELPPQFQQNNLDVRAEGDDESLDSPSSGIRSKRSTGLRKRKRGSSSYADTNRRRQKRKTDSQAQSQSCTSQEQVFKAEVDEEIHDTIIVASSSSPGRSCTGSESNMIDKEPVKQEVLAQNIVVETRSYRSQERRQPSSQRSNQKTIKRERQRFSLPLTPDTRPEKATDAIDAREMLGTSQLPGTTQVEPPTQPEPQREMQKDESAQHRERQAEERERHASQEQREPHAASAPAALSVQQGNAMHLMASLRHTLALAKTATKESFDLRAVADLCFQIQHVATMRAERGREE